MKITASTRLAGLIGWPVSHSLSPAMHNAAAAVLGLDFAYVPLPVAPDDLATAVRALPALGFLGANVTIPHKEAVLPHLDSLDPAAAAIGAVNTIVVSRQPPVASRQSPDTNNPLPITNNLLGYNTDWSGFLADLRARGVEVAGRGCLVLGAGGSARAVVYALQQAGGQVHLFARRPAQAAALAAALKAPQPIHTLDDLAGAVVAKLQPALIVNCTPLGMAPYLDASPWPDGRALPPAAFVYDLVYNPAETRLLRQARAAGNGAANGLGMLVRQGAHAFRLWTGQEPDIAVMTASVARPGS